MPDPVQVLYESRAYPAMSHPLSDPAVSGVGALLGGLQIRHPSQARILEIGCCSGLNLIPLALRWPESEFLGIDLSGASIETANELAAAAGVQNVRFLAADLREFDPGPEPFDWIIAHGFLSWVPDEVKSALFSFCRKHLAPTGIATVSFNVEAGWRPRFPIISKARAILAAGAADRMAALAVLKSVTPAGSPDLAILDDMLAKGEEILAFDDFGPVNDPWSFETFVHTSHAAGLRYLGETDPSTHFPTQISAEQRAQIQSSSPHPLAFHSTLDELSGRTFRSAILCRDDAPIDPRISVKRLLELFVSVQSGVLLDDGNRLIQTIDSFDTDFVSLADIQSVWGNFTEKLLLEDLFSGIQSGAIAARLEPVEVNPSIPSLPDLGGFRVECARRGYALVDGWHRPCGFPPEHVRVLAAMDGSRTLEEHRRMAQTLCPDLAFDPWMAHLAGRGLFVSG